jgi:TetR/AcrR family transcriptional regulator, regulator of cefoperazone and chloramphenicol sensitivity
MAQDDTKARLLQAAGEEFAEKGFEGATIRSIIERARANIAAVNYHFGDKEQLYTQAVIEAARCGVEPDAAALAGLAPADALRLFVRHFLSHVMAVGAHGTWHHRLMLREQLGPTHASETLVREVIGPRFERLKGILGRACPGLDDRRLTVAAFSVIGQCLFYKVAGPIAERLVGADAFAALDLDYLADHVARFSLAALGLEAPIGAAEEAEGRARPKQRTTK